MGEPGVPRELKTQEQGQEWGQDGLYQGGNGWEARSTQLRRGNLELGTRSAPEGTDNCTSRELQHPERASASPRLNAAVHEEVSFPAQGDAGTIRLGPLRGTNGFQRLLKTTFNGQGFCEGLFKRTSNR